MILFVDDIYQKELCNLLLNNVFEISNFFGVKKDFLMIVIYFERRFVVLMKYVLLNGI